MYLPTENDEAWTTGIIELCEQFDEVTGLKGQEEVKRCK